MSFFERHVRAHFDQEFFAALPEAIDNACVLAHTTAAGEGRFNKYHIPYVEGIERHYALQAAMIKLSVEMGAEEVVIRANNYPISAAKHRRFIILGCVADSLKNLNRSKARRYMSGLNEVLEPFQADLFEPEVPVPEASLFGMIIVAKPKGSVLPSSIYFGIPTPSFRGWHFYAEISEIFALYNSPDIPDELDVAKRKPRLRRIARSRSLPKKTQ